MSKGVLINTLDTYIGTALYEEFLGPAPAESEYKVFGTWHSKDDSFKPAFVTKMLKRSKPVLFRKYMREQMDCYIFDLHSGRLDDLKWAVGALTDEPLESEKTLIVISSVLSWGATERKMKEVKPKKKKPKVEGEEEEGAEEENKGEEEEKEDEDEKEGEEGEEAEEKKEEEEKKEPKYDELGNLIEEAKTEILKDAYGNIILEAKLDEEGNEILPENDESFEYYFEEDYIAKKEQEKKEEEERIKREQAELNGEEYHPPEEEEKKQVEEEQKPEEEEHHEEGEEEKKEEEEHKNKSEEEEGEENEEEHVEEKKARVYKRVIQVKKIKPKIFKRIGYSEKEYTKRVPIEFYQKFKEYEDYLLSLKQENLNIYIVCAGIPYGGCETVFNYFFKAAWLQCPSELPYYETGENMVPTIHVKDLAKIVKKLADNKSETPYIFAIDKTKDRTLKNLILSISRNIGSGNTVSIPYNKDLIKNLALKDDDFFIDKSKYEKNKVVMNITKHELSWTRFLGIDVMLNNSKFIDPEFEWHCKEGIPNNTKKLLEEFCGYRKLRPLKIVMNCQDTEYRKIYAEKISKFYNIPIINFELMTDKLNQIKENLTEEQQFMNEKYFFLRDRIDFLDNHPKFKNEANELLYDKDEILSECLKYLLQANDATNRGYVLEGIPVNMDEIQRLYYYKKEIPKEEGQDEEKPEEEEEVDEEEEEAKPEEEEEAKKEEEQPEESQPKNEEEEAKKEENKEGEEDEKEENEEGENESKPKEEEEEAKKEESQPKEEDQPKEDEQPKEGEEEGEEAEKKKKKKKKKKIKPKKYKVKFDKALLPESVITLNKIDQETKDVDNIFWEVENFYQENAIEILDLVYEDKEKDDYEEIFEMMRIYIERNGRPFNYFSLKDEDINENRIKYVQQKQKDIEERKAKEKQDEEDQIKKLEEQYWAKMKERIEQVNKDKKQLEEFENVPTRKFLLVNIMPTLTKGLLEVCKINPVDPIDYLADFLFTHSTTDSKSK